MSEKLRDEFESWLLESTEFDTQRTAFAMTKQEDQQYMCHRTNLAWLAWQASRAALVVELPSFENGSLRGYSGDCDEANMVVDAVAESLDAAGVSYK